MTEYTDELINAVVAYLGKQPYEQTFQLIDELRRQYQDAHKSDNVTAD